MHISVAHCGEPRHLSRVRAPHRPLSGPDPRAGPSRSTGMNNCVETAPLGRDRLAVRDSKDADLPPLRFSATAWTSFVAGLGGGPVS
ncbi:DUF397 domain-containing protein [Streptomyces sp. NPDC005752]|uniref:DUF397 domain-containing protein n=1 Tax=Streptomyces sp. NPDC005752 TaxID=3157065 RepID=UPI0033F34E27